MNYSKIPLESISELIIDEVMEKLDFKNFNINIMDHFGLVIEIIIKDFNKVKVNKINERSIFGVPELENMNENNFMSFINRRITRESKYVGSRMSNSIEYSKITQMNQEIFDYIKRTKCIVLNDPIYITVDSIN